MAAGLYVVRGAEDIRIPRYLSALFWVLGGACLYPLAKRFMSPMAACAVTAYYLFLPLGLLTSVSFQPDALMMLMFTASLLAVMRYSETQTPARLVAASALSASAVLIRPLCLFALVGVLGALSFRGHLGTARSRRGRSSVLLAFSVAPAFLYYSVAFASGRYIASQAEASFVPALLLDSRYWSGWLSAATRAVGVAPLVLGLIGVGLVPAGRSRAFVSGLWIGYVVFCLSFTYHVRFAAYYHLQLAVIVALSAGALVSSLLEDGQRRWSRWYPRLAVAGALSLVVLSAYMQTKAVFGAIGRIESAETARRIGQIVRHSTRTVYLAHAYGEPLEYFGKLAGTYWPRRTVHWALRRSGSGPLGVEERLNALGYRPEFFIITDLEEYRRHHEDLRDYLTANYQVVAETEQYTVWRPRGRSHGT